MVFMTPCLILIACGGFSYLMTLREQSPLRWLAAALVIAGCVGGLSGIDTYYTRPGYENMRPVAEALKAAYSPGDAIFVNPYAYAAFDYYFLADDPSRAPAATEANGNELAAYSSQLDALRQTSKRVWILINCCDASLQTYLEEHGYGKLAPFAQDTNVSLFLLQ